MATLGMTGNSQQASLRKPASIEVLEQARELAVRASNVVELVADKLRPVRIDNSDVMCGESGPVRCFPPLFEDFRSQLDSIDQSLSHITRLLDSTEL